MSIKQAIKIRRSPMLKLRDLSKCMIIIKTLRLYSPIAVSQSNQNKIGVSDIYDHFTWKLLLVSSYEMVLGLTPGCQK